MQTEEQVRQTLRMYERSMGNNRNDSVLYNSYGNVCMILRQVLEEED